MAKRRKQVRGSDEDHRLRTRLQPKRILDGRPLIATPKKKGITYTVQEGRTLTRFHTPRHASSSAPPSNWMSNADHPDWNFHAQCSATTHHYDAHLGRHCLPLSLLHNRAATPQPLPFHRCSSCSARPTASQALSERQAVPPVNPWPTWCCCGCCSTPPEYGRPTSPPAQAPSTMGASALRQVL